ncbi:MAG: hypothetical protein V2J20_11870 [Wenzhouxiangella sp.]|jgi:hypothetical protein|nr:hypothetical protein [Wenzhouxiangella sp.]
MPISGLPARSTIALFTALSLTIATAEEEQIRPEQSEIDEMEPASSDPMDVIRVDAPLTQRGLREEAAALRRIPGGTNLIDLQNRPGRNRTLDDALAFQPGLVVQEFFGGNDQPRINIRGSGC